MRIDPDGVSELVADALPFANGLAIQGEWLYAIESAWPRMIRLPLAGGASSPSSSSSECSPTGWRSTRWVVCGSGAGSRAGSALSPEGALGTIVDDWTGEYVLTPTKLAFAGDDLCVFVLASWGGETVRAIDPRVRGATLSYPEPGLT